jgi:hypothetical protein
MPTPVALAPNCHHGIAVPQQLGCRQRGAVGRPERQSDLALKSAVTRIRERCPPGADPLHMGRISAPTAHSFSLPLLG